MKNFITIIVTGIILFQACKSRSTQNTSTSKSIDSSIEKQEEPEQIKEYRGMYTRSNDLLHTRLEISFNLDSCFAYGKATLTLRPYFYSTNELTLDGKGFNIHSVLNAETKKELKYTYDGKKIKIKLDRTYERNEEYKVFIDYTAMPNKLKAGGSAAISSDKGLYFINPQGKEKNKPTQIWTQGETEANSCWMPTIDGPQEKHTQELFITVNNKFKTLSNGTLVYSTLNGDGTRTDNWKMDLPHATYLTMMAIGEYSIVTDKWRDMDVLYYVEPDYEKNAREIFGKTPEMIEFFSKKLGVDYPWEKYAQVVVRDYVSGAMENTSATVHGEFLQVNHRQYLDVGRNNEDVISHELFHHWFGDLVTAESWANLPVNESFATYGEYLWAEYKYGRDDADYIGLNDLSAYLTTGGNRKKDLVRINYEDKEEMFDAVSYQKGGRVIHMLRKYVGDDAFFASLKLYLERNKFKSAEMHQLRLAFEEITGEDLNWFFNQWWFNHGHPELNIKTTYNDSAKKVIVELKQVQDLKENPLYQLPLDVDVYINGAKERTRITLTKKEEVFELPANSKPQLVVVDAEKMLLGEKNETKTTEEYAFEFKNGPLFLNRYESLKALGKKANDPKAEEIIRLALKDPYHIIRKEALAKVKGLSATTKQLVLDEVKQLALSDPNANVRATALAVLGIDYSDQPIEDVLAITQNDSSYQVVANTLKVYVKKDKSKAMQLAARNELEKSQALADVIAELYSVEGTVKNHSFFINFFETNGGYSPLFLLNHYKKYLLRMDAGTAKEGVAIIQNIIANSSIGFVKNTAKGVLKDLGKKYEQQVADATTNASDKARAQDVLDAIQKSPSN